jgi:DNA (cytosine-5)-methyltransferase 1
MPTLPVIDVFAGPGGLAEGFFSLEEGRGKKALQIALSIEKDAVACRTLKLRAVRRFLADAGELDCYHALLRGEISLDQFDDLTAVQRASGIVRDLVQHREGQRPVSRSRAVTDPREV